MHRREADSIRLTYPVVDLRFFESALLTKVKFVLLFAVIAATTFVAWQIGSCELANYELQDDMKDLSAQMGARIGLVQASSESDIEQAVVRKADKYGIQLSPYQVTVDHYGPAEAPEIHIRAEFEATVNLLIYSFNLHFTPEANNARR